MTEALVPEVMDEPTRSPWQCMSGETDTAYAAFRFYIEQPRGQRRILDAYRQRYGKETAKIPPGWFSAWAKEYLWRERAQAWDEAQDKAAEQEKLAEIRRLARQEVQLGTAMIQASGQVLTEWLRRVSEGKLTEKDAKGEHKTTFAALTKMLDKAPAAAETGSRLWRRGIDTEVKDDAGGKFDLWELVQVLPPDVRTAVMEIVRVELRNG
jgi:hypothetical protein